MAMTVRWARVLPVLVALAAAGSLLRCADAGVGVGNPDSAVPDEGGADSLPDTPTREDALAPCSCVANGFCDGTPGRPFRCDCPALDVLPSTCSATTANAFFGRVIICCEQPL